MSHWGPDSQHLSQETSEGPGIAPGPGVRAVDASASRFEKIQGRPWARFSPYILSALFFMSGLLMVFAPLPIVFLNLRRGWKSAALACFSNGLLVWAMGDLAYLGLYCGLVCMIGMVLPETLRLKCSMEKSVFITFTSVVITFLAGVFAYIAYSKVNLIAQIKDYFIKFTDLLVESFPNSLTDSTLESGGLTAETLESWRTGLMIELPSALAIFCFVMVVASLVLVLKANPNQVRESLGLDGNFVKKWKAPFFLVWPTIVTGLFLVVDAGVVSDVCLNLFKCLMAVFVLQGLGILVFIFDLWGVKGFFRWSAFFMALFLMPPLVLSLGFFDLWFDFRAKFRQS